MVHILRLPSETYTENLFLWKVIGVRRATAELKCGWQRRPMVNKKIGHLAAHECRNVYNPVLDEEEEEEEQDEEAATAASTQILLIFVWK